MVICLLGAQPLMSVLLLNTEGCENCLLRLLGKLFEPLGRWQLDGRRTKKNVDLSVGVSVRKIFPLSLRIAFGLAHENFRSSCSAFSTLSIAFFRSAETRPKSPAIASLLGTVMVKGATGSPAN